MGRRYDTKKYQMLTAEEFAARIGVYPETIRKWRLRGWITGVKIGYRSIRYPVTELVRVFHTGIGKKAPLRAKTYKDMGVTKAGHLNKKPFKKRF